MSISRKSRCLLAAASLVTVLGISVSSSAQSMDPTKDRLGWGQTPAVRTTNMSDADLSKHVGKLSYRCLTDQKVHDGAQFNLMKGTTKGLYTEMYCKGDVQVEGTVTPEGGAPTSCSPSIAKRPDSGQGWGGAMHHSGFNSVEKIGTGVTCSMFGS